MKVVKLRWQVPMRLINSQRQRLYSIYKIIMRNKFVEAVKMKWQALMRSTNSQKLQLYSIYRLVVNPCIARD